jgi:hypothetical protein
MTVTVAIITAVVLGGGAVGLTQLVRPGEAGTDSEWRSRARCGGMDINDFFTPEPTSALRDLCATCPVRSQCYKSAQSSQLIGYWGGTTAAQRRGPFSYIRYLFATVRSLIRVMVTRTTREGRLSSL